MNLFKSQWQRHQFELPEHGRSQRFRHVTFNTGKGLGYETGKDFLGKALVPEQLCGRIYCLKPRAAPEAMIVGQVYFGMDQVDSPFE